MSNIDKIRSLVVRVAPHIEQRVAGVYQSSGAAQQIARWSHRQRRGRQRGGALEHDDRARLRQALADLDAARAELERRIEDARERVKVARVDDQRARALDLYRQADTLHAELTPLLAQITARDGTPAELSPNGRLATLERQAHQMVLNAEELQFRLGPELSARIEAQRDTAPATVDRALQRYLYPQEQPV